MLYEKFPLSKELIDTLWNVNNIPSPELNAQEIGINRYIMECKYNYHRGSETIDMRINRYIMECK